MTDNLESTECRCDVDGCTEQATIHCHWAECRVLTGIKHYCEHHIVAINFPTKAGIGKGHPYSLPGARCFDIELVCIFESEESGQIIFLREVAGHGVMSFETGMFEACGIARRLERFESPRPLTHDAMLNAIRVQGGVVQDVLIHKFEGELFYAHLRIQHAGKLCLVDMRPSDAVTMALIAQCPIFVTDAVLSQLCRNPGLLD